ncbi:hypothetical protein ACOKM5_35890 [Streptomyces sp. BH097]
MYVLALAQITQLMANEYGGTGVLHGLLLAGVWFDWFSYTGARTPYAGPL